MKVLGLILWLLLSSVVIGTSIWSGRILYRQKKAWKEFAAKNNLVYSPGKFMTSPVVGGNIGRHRISLYSEAKPTSDPMGRRYVTILDIQFPEGFSDGGAAGTSRMVPMMEGMSVLKPYTPRSKDWTREHRMYVKSDAAADSFWNEARLKALTALLGTKNADVIFIYDDKEAAVRMETSDPLQNVTRIEKMVQQVIRLTDQIAA